ncbi:MAG: Gfo/Idh/MocA family oxidoreductase [Cyclobacteriaceae bacterium]
MIEVGIVGLGNIGRRHAAYINGLEGINIKALCETKNQALETTSSLYPNAITANMFDEMLAIDGFNLIDICTPHHLHKEMAIEAAERGYNVLVEKPMALTSVDCKEMISAASKNKVKLYVMKQNRFNVPVALVDKVINDGVLGKIYQTHCNVFWNRNIEYYSMSDWRGRKSTEGGALFTQASHFIDLMIWWFGDVVESKTFLKNYFQPIEFEDSGLSLLQFSDGVEGTLNWTTCVYNKNYEGSITIIGENGTIKIGGPYLNKIEFWDVKSYPLPTNINFADTPNSYGKYQGTSSNHDKVFCEIIKDLNGQAGLVVEGFEGIRSVEAIEKIYASAKS